MVNFMSYAMQCLLSQKNTSWWLNICLPDQRCIITTESKSSLFSKSLSGLFPPMWSWANFCSDLTHSNCYLHLKGLINVVQGNHILSSDLNGVLNSRNWVTFDCLTSSDSCCDKTSPKSDQQGPCVASQCWVRGLCRSCHVQNSSLSACPLDWAEVTTWTFNIATLCLFWRIQTQ